MRSILHQYTLHKQRRPQLLHDLVETVAKRGYRQAIDKFVDWYCSEPRLSFNSCCAASSNSSSKTADLLQGQSGVEAADCGLLSPGSSSGVLWRFSVSTLRGRLAFVRRKALWLGLAARSLSLSRGLLLLRARCENWLSCINHECSLLQQMLRRAGFWKAWRTTISFILAATAYVWGKVER